MDEYQRMPVVVKSYPRILGLSFPRYSIYLRKESLHVNKTKAVLLLVAQVIVLVFGSFIALVALVYSIGCLWLLYQPYSEMRHAKIIRWFNTSIILFIIAALSTIIFSITYDLLMRSSIA